MTEKPKRGPGRPRGPGKPLASRVGVGNPNLKKGSNNASGVGAKIIKPHPSIRLYIPTCADFMEKEGWELLKEAARVKYSKSQIPALKLLAAYGYGNPDITMDITSKGRSMNVVGFLSGTSEDDVESEGTGGD